MLSVIVKTNRAIVIVKPSQAGTCYGKPSMCNCYKLSMCYCNEKPSVFKSDKQSNCNCSVKLS